MPAKKKTPARKNPEATYYQRIARSILDDIDNFTGYLRLDLRELAKAKSPGEAHSLLTRMCDQTLMLWGSLDRRAFSQVQILEEFMQAHSATRKEQPK